MADFCHSCSIEVWGEDTRDFAGLSTPSDTANGRYPLVLCEDCGLIQVDHEGCRAAGPYADLPRIHEPAPKESVR